MKIGIIGCGKVGGTLGKRWAHKGHDVIFGSRHPDSEDMRQLQLEAGPHCCAASVKEAAALGDVVVLAVPWAEAQNAIKEAGNLEGRIVIDVTNPFKQGAHGLPVGMEVDADTSAAELVAKWAPNARIVKAFNHMSFLVMDDPDFEGRPATAFIAGDHAEAKQVVSRLASDLGLEPFDVGPLHMARYIEAFAMLYIDMVYVQGHDPHFAFSVITRKAPAKMEREAVAAGAK